MFWFFFAQVNIPQVALVALQFKKNSVLVQESNLATIQCTLTFSSGSATASKLKFVVAQRKKR